MIWVTCAEVSWFLRAVCRSQLPSGSPSNTLRTVVTPPAETPPGGEAEGDQASLELLLDGRWRPALAQVQLQ